MLIFGPSYAIPINEGFVIYNLSSLAQNIPRTPGLMVTPNISLYGDNDNREMNEYLFDCWYADYLINDPIACSSLMSILNSLYDGNKVFICISEYLNDPYISIVNESFMKLIQSRYDIVYSIINEVSDYDYIPKDGCDFASLRGIETYDADRKRYTETLVETDKALLNKLMKEEGLI